MSVRATRPPSSPSVLSQNVSRALSPASGLPGPSDEPDRCVWLPIDSKFPQEDYLRLVEASDNGDTAAVQVAQSALIRAKRRALATDGAQTALG